MSKSILLSIRPQWVAWILNGNKIIEIRKKFPNDYVGWVYIYCTNNHIGANNGNVIGRVFPINTALKTIKGRGKVVARFWCDKVEEIKYIGFECYSVDLHKACLSFEELDNYLQTKKGYAIHISKLEIFDKPKEISEFTIKVFPHRKDNLMTRYLTRAPQSYCFIEID